MQIESYFLLTSTLGRTILKRRLKEEDKQTTEQQSDKHRQYEFRDNSQEEFVLTVSAVTDRLVVVNLIRPRDSKSESVVVNWEDQDIRQLAKLPMKEDEVSEELIGVFGEKLAKLDVLVGYSGNESRLYEGGGREESISWERPPNSPPGSSGAPGHSSVFNPPIETPMGIGRPADMPDFEDEYQMRPQRGDLATGATFPTIGDQDLNPPGLPRHPPLKPYLGPENPGSDGGMYPTSSHPLFGTRGSSGSRLGVPPGARYDDPVTEDDLDMLGAGLPGGLGRGLGGSNTFGPGPGGFPPGSGNSGPFGF